METRGVGSGGGCRKAQRSDVMLGELQQQQKEGRHSRGMMRTGWVYLELQISALSEKTRLFRNGNSKVWYGTCEGLKSRILAFLAKKACFTVTVQHQGVWSLNFHSPWSAAVYFVTQATERHWKIFVSCFSCMWSVCRIFVPYEQLWGCDRSLHLELQSELQNHFIGSNSDTFYI